MTASGPGGGATPGEPDGTPSVPEYVWRLFLEDDERAIRASAPREPATRDRTPGRRPDPSAGPERPVGPESRGAAESPGGREPRGGPQPGDVQASQEGPQPPSAVPGRDAGPDTSRDAGPDTGRDTGPDARPWPSARPGRSTRPGPSGHPSDTVGEAWRPEDPWRGPAWRELDGRARLRRAGRVLGTAAAVALALAAWSHLSTGPVAPGTAPAETIGQHREESPALPTPDSRAGSLTPTESTAAGAAVFEPAPSAIPRASDSPWTVD
ncbi:hypothetical protein [Streptomyces sp. NPDC048392]|uniref:hypothetical protein n=1 Tax=Streptomyces sp. NPDC048392 TaxID=3365543 RepID=UPI00371AA063